MGNRREPRARPRRRTETHGVFEPEAAQRELRRFFFVRGWLRSCSTAREATAATAVLLLGSHTGGLLLGSHSPPVWRSWPPPLDARSHGPEGCVYFARPPKVQHASPPFPGRGSASKSRGMVPAYKATMRTHTVTILTLGILLAGTNARAQSESAEVQSAARDSTAAGHHFVLQPTVAGNIGYSTLVSSEFGGRLQYSVSDTIRVGAGGQWSSKIINGPEGCSTALRCVDDWKRATLNAEYHQVLSAPSVELWFGVDAGPEWQHSLLMAEDGKPEDRLRAVVLPALGLDFGVELGPSYLGLGIFAGVPIAFGSKQTDTGTQVGVRGLVGIF